MGRVPVNPVYGILGSGRLARHLAFYLRNTHHSLNTWSRNSDPEFNSSDKNTVDERWLDVVQNSDVILLAVSDRALPEVAGRLKDFISTPKALVHFSGSENIPGVTGLHPLMSFTPQLYSLDVYSKIPFCEERSLEGAFRDIFPNLSNPVFSLSYEERKLYHAYLVVAGNFTSLLWRDVEQKFAQKLKLDARLLRHYKRTILTNVMENAQQSVTGPLIRGDLITQERNKEALSGDSLLVIYESFQKAFQTRSEKS